jgi:hypothetical protein
MKKDRREQSERFLHKMRDHVINVIMIAGLGLIPSFCFRRINHMALKPFALILCLHVAVHHVANNTDSID